MTLLQSIILGIVQGISEFLPISSSGHLVLVPYLLGWHIPPKETFVFDVLVQVATLLAVFTFFYKDIFQIVRAFLKGIIDRKPFEDEYSRLGWYIILATIPAGVIGLLFKDSIEAVFNSPRTTAMALIFTGLLLTFGELINKDKLHKTHISVLDALWMGLFQVLAIIPGSSRSGATITGGLTRKIKRREAARFSFLMSIPVMLAAGLLAFLDLIKMPEFSNQISVYLAGFLTSAIVGYFSIKWLLAYLTKKSMFIFAIYCFLFGTGVLLFFH